MLAVDAVDRAVSLGGMMVLESTGVLDELTDEIEVLLAIDRTKVLLLVKVCVEVLRSISTALGIDPVLAQSFSTFAFILVKAATPIAYTFSGAIPTLIRFVAVFCSAVSDNTQAASVFRFLCLRPQAYWAASVSSATTLGARSTASL